MRLRSYATGAAAMATPPTCSSVSRSAGRRCIGAKVTATQVGLCLIDLKLARLVGDPTHLDSLVDVAGYAACVREVSR